LRNHTKLNTIGDLQGGMEEAERFLGLKVVASGEERRLIAPPGGP
jgi:hypothetical protein